MSTAWSIGHGRKSIPFLLFNLDISNFARDHSPGPAAYYPNVRSKTPNPRWR